MRFARIAAFAVALCALTPQAGSAQRQQDVRIDFQVSDATIRLEVFSSAPFTIDPAALHFSLRPYRNFAVDTATPPIAAAATLGTPIPGGVPQRPIYQITVSVAPPAKPGMYELAADTDPAFARTVNGTSLPVRRFPSAGIGAIAAWWPDERGGDPGLRAIQARFTGRVAHAYGGVVRTCDVPGESWGTEYRAETPLRVEAVTREQGRVALLREGAGAGDYGFRFIAFDPIAIRIANPHDTPPSYGACPFVVRYADPWHVETGLTVAVLPKFSATHGFPVRRGMSRDEVVWRMGYPDQYGTVASFRALDRWTYVEPAPYAWWVEFENDRVVAVQPPGNLP
ncbi:MAG TPA: hypothetical protein VHS78_10490 [Candidatus Elarobacter sp.]|nr:hypothetical protein [Candidatus Elarobacter sp.]